MVRRGRVRRAKLYYLRGRRGKAARITERQEVRGKKAEAFKGFTRPKGEPDDLKLIPGVGQELEHKLNKLGLIKFEQIANLTDDEIAKLDEALKLNGAIENNDWVAEIGRADGRDHGRRGPRPGRGSVRRRRGRCRGEARKAGAKAKDAKPAKKPKKG